MANIDSKRNGRFIKKSDPLHKVLNISDFSLADICETPITFADNANANIIHEKLHLKSELAETVRLSHEIENVFQSPEERILIRPLDFTEEWHRLRKRQSSRSQRSDDEDEFDLESARAEEARQDAEDLEAMENRNRSAAGLPPLGQAGPEASPEGLQGEPAEIMGEAAAPAKGPAVQEPPQPEAEEFVPYAQNPTPDSFSTPERGLSDEELEQIISEAREEGFRQGYQSGEERATLESRSKVQSILEEVANIAENLEGMQKSILGQVQSNFYNICKSFIESMLHKEFTMNPDIFGSVIERAVNEALNDDEFKIFVSPKVARDLKSWSNEKLQSRLRSDDSLNDFNFRVEGEHASVDANIGKIVKDLLDQADLNLFDTNDKVG